MSTALGINVVRVQAFHLCNRRVSSHEMSLHLLDARTARRAAGTRSGRAACLSDISDITMPHAKPAA